MRIDYDLLREMLIGIAEHDGSFSLSTASFYDFHPSKEVVRFHIYILVQEGLLSGIDVSDKEGFDYQEIGLTLKGSQFLDKVAADSAWSNIKSFIRDKSVEISFEAITLAIASLNC